MSRPFSLDPLFCPLFSLPGIGPRNGKILEKLLGGAKILNLLFHSPVDCIDRTLCTNISEAPNGKIVTLVLRVDKHSPNPRKSLPYKVRCVDHTGKISLIFFHANKDWLTKQLPEGQNVIVSGRVDYFQGSPQIVHPDVIAKPENRNQVVRIEPIYRLSQGLTNKMLCKWVESALASTPTLPEWLDKSFVEKNNWPSWNEAIKTLHNPIDPNSFSPKHPAKMRLAYDELLANQLTLSLMRDRERKVNGRSFPASKILRKKIDLALPFTLTSAQKRSLSEIDSDMAESKRMLRLLQGDVGSGKTIVAFYAMLNAIESGCQAVLMAPTEILVRQHFSSMSNWLAATDIKSVCLTGRDKGKKRDGILQQIHDGSAQIIIGTHAVFQSDVVYKDLGIAVIDEQHRFGVNQRLELSRKNSGIDLLVMTATPIPRTLALTSFGDMDISKLDVKPPGRKPIQTLLVPIEKSAEMIDALKRKIQVGARIYWVCPLVAESEILDLAAAEERYDILRSILGDKVGLLHGQMKALEKDTVMNKFIAGEINVLVTTTVIEVGVNVPEASIMVIEHAERFGLSQLHQLRGRVGRGDMQSYCFLLYTGPLGETAKQRLSIMRQTEDGFLIAEKDLELRGSGDILGVRQSGITEFRLADLAAHGDLLVTARDDAKLIIAKDPALAKTRGDALRMLLYLFERDQAIQYFLSG